MYLSGLKADNVLLRGQREETAGHRECLHNGFGCLSGFSGTTTQRSDAVKCSSESWFLRTNHCSEHSTTIFLFFYVLWAVFFLIRSPTAVKWAKFTPQDRKTCKMYLNPRLKRLMICVERVVGFSSTTKFHSALIFFYCSIANKRKRCAVILKTFLKHHFLCH